MEQLLHYVWKHKMFPITELQTTDGLTVEVIDPVSTTVMRDRFLQRKGKD